VKSITGIELAVIVLKDEAFENPFEIWDGRLPLHSVGHLQHLLTQKHA
jgi:hypothetical protein